MSDVSVLILDTVGYADDDRVTVAHEVGDAVLDDVAEFEFVALNVAPAENEILDDTELVCEVVKVDSIVVKAVRVFKLETDMTAEDDVSADEDAVAVTVDDTVDSGEFVVKALRVAVSVGERDCEPVLDEVCDDEVVAVTLDVRNDDTDGEEVCVKSGIEEKLKKGVEEKFGVPENVILPDVVISFVLEKKAV